MPPPIRIENAADPRIAAYRDIRERDLVGRQGRFVAEGKVVLRVLFSAARFEPESALILESRLAGMAEVLATAPAAMPVYAASAPVMDAVAGFAIHRGVLAIGRRRAADYPAGLLAALPERAVVVVLAGISNHDNVGAIFRNAAGFGAAGVLLDAASCDPLYRKAIRVSAGAVLKLPYAVGPDAATLRSALAAAGFVQLALSPSGSEDVRNLARPARLALWLGSEGDGLPASLLAELQSVRIAMAPGFDSLNVAAASAVALHHFYAA
jgi:tRNA G18 (ribose-2'-O)-methylase SpoU